MSRWTSGLAAASLVGAASLGELALWIALGAAGDVAWTLGATLAAAAVAAGIALGSSFVLSGPLAAAAGAAVALWPFAMHAVHRSGAPGALLLPLSLAAAALGGALAAAVARRPAWLAALGVAAAVAAAPAALALWSARSPARPDPPPAAASDVVLLVLDTTRRDHLSLYGHPEKTTPEIDALARSARVYDDAWSAAPWTAPSHASMFTGLLPAEHDVDGTDAPPLPSGLRTLAGALRDAGYRTAGFVANPNLLSPGWSRDFDVWEPPWIRGSHTLVLLANTLLRGDSDPWQQNRTTGTTARVLAGARRWWAANEGAHRFLFLNVLDPHAPYRAPPADVERFVRGRDCERGRLISDGGFYEYAHTRIAPADRACIAALYDAELHAMDREVGAFFRWVEERGELHRTLVVITSDHGERLGESGHVGHLFEMDQHLLRVPLIARHPETLPPGRVGERVMLTGLPGFVLAHQGLPVPDAMARWSFPVAAGRPAVAQHRHFGWYFDRIRAEDPGFDFSPQRGDWTAVADGDLLLRWSPEQGIDAAQLYDTAADPELAHDLAAARPDDVAALRAIAEALPRFGDATDRARAAPLDPEQARRLRELGYLRDDAETGRAR